MKGPLTDQRIEPMCGKGVENEEKAFIQCHSCCLWTLCASAYPPSQSLLLPSFKNNKLTHNSVTVMHAHHSGYASVSCAGEEGFTETLDCSIMWPHSLNTMRRPWQSPHNCYLCRQIMVPIFSPSLLISFSLPFYCVTLSTWGPMGRRGSLLTVSVAKLFQQQKKKTYPQKLQSYIHASVSSVWLKWELLWKLFIRTMFFFFFLILDSVQIRWHVQ